MNTMMSVLRMDDRFPNSDVTETETPLAPQRADNQVEGEGGFGAPRFPRPLQVATTEGVLLPSMAEFERGVPAFTETQVGGGRRAAQVRYEEEGDDEEEMADELERDMRRAAGQKRKD